MTVLRRIAMALRALLRPAAKDREMDAEIRFHLEMQASQHEAAGASPDEARRRARMEFGGVERFREAGGSPIHVAGREVGPTVEGEA